MPVIRYNSKKPNDHNLEKALRVDFDMTKYPQMTHLTKMTG